MKNWELSPLTYSQHQIEKKIRERSKKRGTPHIITTIGMGQKIMVEGYVLCNWKLEADILDGIYILKSNFHEIRKIDNVKGGFSYYQVQRDADEIAILVRVSG